MTCWALKENHNCPVAFLQPIIPNSLASFIHDKIVNMCRELDSCSGPLTYDPFHPLLLLLSLKISCTNWSHSLSLKACSLSPISSSLLKSCSDNLTAIIAKVIASLLSGSVLQCFKQALVTPLLKKPTLDKTTLKSYHPVSNIPYL